MVLEGGRAALRRLVGVEVLHGETRVLVGKDVLLVPLELDPRRVPEHEVEAAPRLKHVCELELPVEEVVLLGDLPCEIQRRELPAEVVEVDDLVRTELVLHLAELELLRSLEALTKVEGHLQRGLVLDPSDPLGRSDEDKRHVHEELVPRGEEVGLLDGPEPERAPIVHGELEPCVGPGVACVLAAVEHREQGILLPDARVTRAFRVLEAVALESIDGILSQEALLLHLLRPQAIDFVRELTERAYLGWAIWGDESPVPPLDCLELLRFEVPDDPVVILRHPWVANQKVIHAMALGAARLEAHTLGLVVVPAYAPRPRGEVLLRVSLPPGADEGVSTVQLVAKPRDVSVLTDGVEPQRYLPQLDRDGVEVYAIDVAVGDEHLHALQLVLAAVVGNRLPELLLLAREVCLGKLVDHLVQERRGPHGGLAYGEMQDLVSGLSLEQLLECVLDETPGQTLWGVVRGGLLAFPARETVDEVPLLVGPELAPLGTGLVADTLVLRVEAKLVLRDEVADVKWVEGDPRALDLVEAL